MLRFEWLKMSDPKKSDIARKTGSVPKQPIAAKAAATPNPATFPGKLFKKCKSATFQIDGHTYTIGKVLKIYFEGGSGIYPFQLEYR